jgi:Fur family ferric uptake transcriptional regulator
VVIRTSEDQPTRRSRATRQRRAVEALIDGHTSFRSAQDLHAELRGAGAGVGLATICRILERMAEAGEVDTLRCDSGEVLYRRCRSEGQPHYHLICRDCRCSSG